MVGATGVFLAVYKIIGTEKLSNVVSEKNIPGDKKQAEKKHTCLVLVRLGTNQTLLSVLLRKDPLRCV